MPYKIVGSDIYVKKAGKWRKKQRCGSPTKARSALRLLNAVKHGFKPTGKT